MLDTLKGRWRAFEHERPGRRFQERYERNQHLRERKPMHRHVLKAGVALAVTGIGLALLFLPGPGIVFLLLGAGMLSDQFLSVARFLDWVELRLRRAWTWLASRRKRPRTSAPARSST